LDAVQRPEVADMLVRGQARAWSWGGQSDIETVIIGRIGGGFARLLGVTPTAARER
jgi:hypothetical protein